jgi:hypothetical protein
VQLDPHLLHAVELAPDGVEPRHVAPAGVEAELEHHGVPREVARVVLPERGRRDPLARRPLADEHARHGGGGVDRLARGAPGRGGGAVAAAGRGPPPPRRTGRRAGREAGGRPPRGSKRVGTHGARGSRGRRAARGPATGARRRPASVRARARSANGGSWVTRRGGRAGGVVWLKSVSGNSGLNCLVGGLTQHGRRFLVWLSD